MALVNTGSLQLGLPRSLPANQNISSEFGGAPAPYSLSEYYGAAPGVPGSGTIKFSDFYGTSSYTPVSINISNLPDRYSFIRDTSPPYVFNHNVSETTNLSVTGGNGSYTYDWSGPNAYSSNSYPAYTVGFNAINVLTTANVTISAQNNTNAPVFAIRTATYGISVTDGTSNASSNFTWEVTFDSVEG